MTYLSIKRQYYQQKDNIINKKTTLSLKILYNQKRQYF